MSKVRCTFCGRFQNTVVTGDSGLMICDECIVLCSGLLKKKSVSADKLPKLRGTALLKPSEIKAALDEYVIGQEHAKKILAVAVYNHYKRLECLEKPDQGVELQKSNVLLLGPTGCGKTLLAQTLAKVLDVPFAIADATNLTEAGYVGEDVESILLSLLRAADYDQHRVEHGIIYIDEIDKITSRASATLSTRDASGEGVQQALLRMLEGSVIDIPLKGSRKHPQQESLRIDTTNILFICGGAFSGLEDFAYYRLVPPTRVGFDVGGTEASSDTDESLNGLLGKIQPVDLLDFGLIPEFVGRLPVIAVLQELDEKALVRILQEPKNALVKQYQYLFELENTELHFTPGALHTIAEAAYSRGAGARGLRSILEDIMLDIMYELPTQKRVKKVIITKRVITRGVKPTRIWES